MDLTESFAQAFTAVSGHVHTAADWDAACAAIAAIMTTKGATSIATAQLPAPLQERLKDYCVAHQIRLLEEPFAGEGLPTRIDETDIGITGMAFAIAQSGTLVEVSTNDATRLVSSLPDTHIGVVSAGEMVGTFREGAARLRQVFDAHPGGVVASLISGPSRTGDIELILTLGVHGPEDAHALILTGDVHAS